MSVLAARYLGRIPYSEGLLAQQQAWEQRLAGATCDTLLLLEHDSVFTAGRRQVPHNLRVPEQQLAAPLVQTDRGGELTYHGPGQLVGYFHAKLSELCPGRGPDKDKDTSSGIGVKELIFRLEESIILFLRRHYGLEAWRDYRHRGVWLGTGEGVRKIAALGIAIRRGVSLHGFALNIATDLRFFAQIVPCGIIGRGVTSLLRELQNSPQETKEIEGNLFIPRLAEQLTKHFCEAFGYTELNFG